MAPESEDPAAALLAPTHMLWLHCAVGPRLLPLTAVVEVLPMVALETFGVEPGACFAGVLHYRGALVPVFDTAPLPPQPELSPDWYLVLARCTAGLVAVVGHEVEDIVEVAPEHRRQVRAGRRQLRGALVDDTFVRELDLEALCGPDGA